MSVPVPGQTLTLLGGVMVDGEFVRSALMRPVDGNLERELAHIDASEATNPERLSRLLCAALSSFAGHPAEMGVVDELCSGDRLYLLLQIACTIDGDTMWLFPACARCASNFDIHIDRHELPVQRAGDGFPFATVEIRAQRAVFRVPTGADERWIAQCTEPVSERDLLGRCLVSVNDTPASHDFIKTLAPDDIAAVEAALDRVAPDVSSRLAATCPECAHQQVVEFDVTALQHLSIDRIVDDVHTLASHYHWNEADILSLPREWRFRYLSCIERSRGLHG